MMAMEVRVSQAQARRFCSQVKLPVRLLTELRTVQQGMYSDPIWQARQLVTRILGWSITIG